MQAERTLRYLRHSPLRISQAAQFAFGAPVRSQPATPASAWRPAPGADEGAGVMQLVTSQVSSN